MMRQLVKNVSLGDIVEISTPLGSFGPIEGRVNALSALHIDLYANKNKGYSRGNVHCPIEIIKSCKVLRKGSVSDFCKNLREFLEQGPFLIGDYVSVEYKRWLFSQLSEGYISGINQQKLVIAEKDPYGYYKEKEGFVIPSGPDKYREIEWGKLISCAHR